jgi:DNA-binding response OmpR family regulator
VRRGTETILLVEDDVQVRALARTVLEAQGYVVLVANGPDAALQLAAERPGEIALLITDVVMPGMSGRELARRVAPGRPGLRVLYISGYTEDVVAHHGVLEPGLTLLQKPFTPQALSRMVREVLDRPPTAPADRRPLQG